LPLNIFAPIQTVSRHANCGRTGFSVVRRRHCWIGDAELITSTDSIEAVYLWIISS